MRHAILIGAIVFSLSHYQSICVGDEPTATREKGDVANGERLFKRTWRVRDQLSPDGDGLGPLFNGRSCAECHNQGGVGGGGGVRHNVSFATIVGRRRSLGGTESERFSTSLEILEKAQANRIAPLHEMLVAQQEKFDQLMKTQKSLLAEDYPEFRDSDTILIHKNGSPSRSHRLWLRRFSPERASSFRVSARGTNVTLEGPQLFSMFVTSDDNSFIRPVSRQAVIAQTRLVGQSKPRDQVIVNRGDSRIISFERNATALFGAGLIDAVPDEAIEAAAAVKYEDWPAVSGRVSRLEDGSIGRFGWKSDKATLRNFVVAACALELGLQNPDHDQAARFYETAASRRKSSRQKNADIRNMEDEKLIDITTQQCNDLAAYVASFPSPEPTGHGSEKGYQLFQSVGCTACHVEKLASANGIYSDLLLHDIGSQSSGSGSYYGFSPADLAANDKTDSSEDNGTARAREWRTSPLWGVRHSAPYMHDGRAGDIPQAIALHGGEALHSARAFFALSKNDQEQVLNFLTSL